MNVPSLSRTAAALATLAFALGAAAPTARSESLVQYSFHIPRYHLPMTRQVVNDQCSPGYRRVTDWGRAMCVQCRDNYHYMPFYAAPGSPRDARCIQCQAGYSYATYDASGRSLCVRCPPGYIFLVSQGRNLCVSRR